MKQSDQEGQAKPKRCRICGKRSPDTGAIMRNTCSDCAYHAMQTQYAYNRKLRDLKQLLDQLDDHGSKSTTFRD